MTDKRFCFYIPPDGFVEGRGYRVAVVTENAPGYGLTGNVPEGGDQEPWYWGKTLGDAEKTCASMNREMGLSDSDVTLIIASSMGRTKDEMRQLKRALERSDAKRVRSAKRAGGRR